MNPYEYHNGQLGVKITYLITPNKRPSKSGCKDSLNLITYNAISKRMSANTCMETYLRKSSRYACALVLFNSLSMQWQTMLIEKFGEAPANLRHSYIYGFYEYDTQAYNFYCNYIYGKDNNRLDDASIAELTINASVLQAVSRIKADRTAYRQLLKGSTRNIWDSISYDVNHFHEVIHTLPTSPDGLRKKYASFYSKDGIDYTALIDGRRGNQNARIVTDKVIKLLNDMFAGQKHKPTATEVFKTYASFLDKYTEVISSETGEIYLPSDFPKISRSTVMAYLSQWENVVATHQLRGADRQVNMTRFTPHAETDLPTFAGSIISIDDRQPPFYYDKSTRMWFYLGVDIASRAVTTFVWGKTKEEMIMEFYRQMVRNYAQWGFNIPNELECESNLNASFRHTFLSDGSMFQKVRIEANNARGKYIERINGKFRYEMEKQHYGWIGRPKARAEANQAVPGKEIFIPYDQLVEQCLKDIEDYNNMPHPENSEISRWEYFTEMQNPNLQPTNWRAIMPHLGYETKSSCNVGYVILQGRKRMIAQDDEILAGEPLINIMRRIEGKDITCYWLDGNDGGVLKAMVYLGDEYICELKPIPRFQRAAIERTPQDEANYLIQNKYRMTVEAFARQRMKDIDKVVLIEHKPKTLNRKFQISQLNRFQQRPETEAVEDLGYAHQEAELPTLPTERPRSDIWKQSFL